MIIQTTSASKKASKMLVTTMTFIVFAISNVHSDPKEDEDISITKSNLKPRHKKGELIFSDEFDSFNLETWNHEITLGGNENWEFQMYVNSRSNTFVKNGHLHIKPTLTSDRYGVDFVYNGQLSLQGGFPVEPCTATANYGCYRSGNYPDIINPVMSAKIRTVNSVYFQYGRVDVRAKLPGGDWMAPAIRLIPRFNQYGKWPVSGEMDIVGSRGNRKLFDENGENFGSEVVFSGLHFGPHWQHTGYERTVVRVTAPDDRGFDTEFHLYSIQWTDEQISFLLDNATTRTIAPSEYGFWDFGFESTFKNPWKTPVSNKRMAPFDQKFFLSLQIGVGGTQGFWPENCRTGKERRKKPWENSSDHANLYFYEAFNQWYPTWDGLNGTFIVDYIRLYAI